MVQSKEERKARAKLRSQTPEYKIKKKEYSQRSERKEYDKLRNQKPERKARAKLRSQTPEAIARRKELRARPDVKAKRKEQRQTPKARAKRKEYLKTYLPSPETTVRKNERESTPEFKAKRKEYLKKYHASPEARAKRKENDSRPENVLKRKESNARPERKAYMTARALTPEFRAQIKKGQDDMRLKVLEFYSKHLSKSNIPCCNCCGENSHIEFLALDHIAGKKEMDSEPELVKLGYSSTLTQRPLQRWIIDNNFPAGFQILCHNCNSAKGFLKNNNECPMKGKPH